MRWVLATLVVMVLALQYRIWVSPDGARELWRLERAVAAQRAENQQLQLRNEQLFAEVRDLKQGFAAVEERARSELGLIAPNETYYQVVPQAMPRQEDAAEAPLAGPGPTALAAAGR
jgi:cell division protein FtsB